MSANVATYAVGEEVVVRLGRAHIYDARAGAPVGRPRVPGWTIARVVHRENTIDGLRYVLSFAHRHAPYLCAVAAAAIDGLA